MELKALKMTVFSIIVHIVCGLESNHSTESILSLLIYENDLIRLIQKYIRTETERINFASQTIENWNRKSTYKEKHEFGHNPIEIFRIVKHLAVDFQYLEKKLIAKYLDHKYFRNYRNQTHNLWKIFLNDLQIIDILDNNNEFLIHGKKLSISDIIKIGKECIEIHNFEESQRWVMKLDDTQISDEMKKLVYDIMVRAYMYSGQVNEAHYTLYKWLFLEWDYGVRNALSLDLIKRLDQLNKFPWYNQIEESHKVCAGDYDGITPRSDFKCFYKNKANPFLKLAPIKYEALSDNPIVFIIREAIYDWEIKQLEEDNLEKLKSAKVGGDNERLDLSYRPSQSTFCYNQTDYFALLMRIQDITNAPYWNGEALSIIHYSPGGFYRKHSDYLDPEALYVNITGNRMWTALIYLNDVAYGGETVFPGLKLKVTPTKGSILCWINMTEDRHQQVLTDHAACPVIYGEKLAATKWVREASCDARMNTRPDTKCYKIPT